MQMTELELKVLQAKAAKLDKIQAREKNYNLRRDARVKIILRKAAAAKIMVTEAEVDTFLKK